MVVMITGPAFANINWGTYISMYDLCGETRRCSHHCALVFAAFNAAIIPITYLFFPETAGRSLEGALLHLNSTRLPINEVLLHPFADMDVVFALAYNEGVSPVGVSLRKDVPLAGTPEADEILGLTQSGTQRKSSDSAESPVITDKKREAE